MKLRTAWLPLAFAVTALACSSSNDMPVGASGTGGATSGQGGASATGGSTVTGGNNGTGGATSTGNGMGGSTNRGGGSATGGSTGSGGTNGSGGSSSTGTGGGRVSDAAIVDARTTASDARNSSGDAAGRSDGAPVVAPPFTASFFIGADITWVQHDEFYGATYVDTDGTTKDILTLLKNHGFNAVRLRTFVDPKAADGYDKIDGFADLAHTVTMGQRIKQAGMGFYLAVHYSDNWADPGKQCTPVAWQQDTTITALAQHLRDYTTNLVSTLKNSGARPDLVQVGNEITGGMLRDICDVNGIPTGMAPPVTGSTSNWANLGTLLKAGIQAVKAVDPTIKAVLHIDRGGDVNASMNWLNNALGQNIVFDIFADTSYVRWQGQPSTWQSNFRTLAATAAYNNLSFLIPEYGNETATSPATPSTMRIANDIMFGMAGNRGVGTFFYEPEHPVQAGIGIGLFGTTQTDAGVTDAWPVFTALPNAMAVYDQMRLDYAGRL